MHANAGTRRCLMPEPSNEHREIERKFLVRILPDNLPGFPHRAIEQGYLVSESNGLQVRLRKAGDRRSLTFKREKNDGREEREIELSLEQFDLLWPATAEKRLTKTRYEVPYENWIVEIDIYSGRHQGLIVAEVEFDSEKAARNFQPPDWLGKDVTGDPRYSNQLLASDPEQLILPPSRA